MISFVQANGVIPISGSGTVTTQPAQYARTAFGESRVSMPLALLNLVNRYGIDTRILATTASANSAVVADTGSSSVVLQLSASAGAFCELSTRQYYRYQAARGQRFTMSIMNSGTAVAGQNRLWGSFDANNGLFYKLSGTTLGVTIRSNVGGAPVDTFTSQTLWNIDKLDGTGPSGQTLDITKGNIYECSYEWLGVGSIYWFVNGFPVHTVNNQNLNAFPYMATAILPLRVRVENTGTASTGSLRLVCANISSENGAVRAGWSFAAEAGSYTTSGTTEVPLISIQLTSTFNGVDNRARIRPTSFNALVSTGGPLIFRVRSNPTLAGASFQTVDPQSCVNFDTTSQSGTTSGTLIAGPFYVANSGSVTVDLGQVFPNTPEGIRRLARDPFTGVSDILTVTVQRQGAANGTANAGISWNEDL